LHLLSLGLIFGQTRKLNSANPRERKAYAKNL